MASSGVKPSLLGKSKYKYNDFITINIPNISFIRGDNEEEELRYYATIKVFTNTPSDMILELTEMGFEFDKVSEYTLFTILFLIAQNTPELYFFDKLFDNFNIAEISAIEQEGVTIFVNKQGNIIFNEKIYLELADLLRQMMFWDKTKPIHCGNNRVRQFHINKAKKLRERELERIKNGKQSSVTMDNVILRLVCNKDFKYDFQTVNSLTVFDFWASVKQVLKNEEVDVLSNAYYSGNLDTSKFDTRLLNKNIL